MAFMYSNERKSHLSLTLSQKVEMIKSNEEGMAKVETSQELGPWAKQSVKL